MEIEQFNVQCGEIFISKQSNFVISCTLCEKYFEDFENFKQHTLEFDCSIEFEKDGFLTPVQINDDVNENHELDNYFPEDVMKVEDEDIHEPLNEYVEIYETLDCEKTTGTKLFKCQICFEKFKSSPPLTKHILEQHSVNGFVKCAHCDDKFSSDDLIRKNLYKHMTSKHYEIFKPKESVQRSFKKIGSESEKKYWIYRCHICDTKFRSSSPLTKHIQTIHTVDGYVKCSYCEEEFLSDDSIRKNLYQHMISSHFELFRGPKPSQGMTRFQCRYCERHYSKKIARNIHEDYAHKGIRRHQCDQCDKAFSTRGLLRQHHVVHTQEKISCDLCDAKASTKYNLFVHKRCKHPESIPFECQKCLKRYSTKFFLEKHICKPKLLKKGHRRKSRINTNMYCGVLENGVKLVEDNTGNLTEVPIYINPVRKKSNESDYKIFCEICGKGFRTKSSMIIHHRSHTGEKPFKCNDCELSFNAAYKLKHHSSIHTGAKPYKCLVCNKTFRTNERLKIHIRSHTGERPYKCDFVFHDNELCAKAFHSLHNLNEHKKHVHKKCQIKIVP